MLKVVCTKTDCKLLKFGFIEQHAPLAFDQPYLSEVQWIWHFKKNPAISAFIFSASHPCVAFEYTEESMEELTLVLLLGSSCPHSA